MLQRDRSSAEGTAGTVHRLFPWVAWHFPRHAVHWGPGGHGCVWTQTCQLGKARRPGGGRGGQDHGSPDPQATLLTPGARLTGGSAPPNGHGGRLASREGAPAQGVRGSGTGHARHWGWRSQDPVGQGTRPSPEAVGLVGWKGLSAAGLFAGLSPDGLVRCPPQPQPQPVVLERIPKARAPRTSERGLAWKRGL